VVSGAGPRPIDQVLHFDLRESMHGGGGPACLRLRVVLTEEEERALAPGVRFTPGLHERLTGWVERHYRDVLMPEDLGDPAFLRECQGALDELTRLLGLGALYDFQR
jgi:succinylarginine dihydrolase